MGLNRSFANILTFITYVLIICWTNFVIANDNVSHPVCIKFFTKISNNSIAASNEASIADLNSYTMSTNEIRAKSDLNFKEKADFNPFNEDKAYNYAIIKLPYDKGSVYRGMRISPTQLLDIFDNGMNPKDSAFKSINVGDPHLATTFSIYPGSHRTDLSVPLLSAIFVIRPVFLKLKRSESRHIDRNIWWFEIKGAYLVNLRAKSLDDLFVYVPNSAKNRLEMQKSLQVHE